jgi:rod shape determining protein RodA
MKSLPSGRERSSGPTSFRNLRWEELDWHTLAVAGVLLAFGLVFLNAMAVADGAFEGRRISFEGHLRKLAVATPFLLLGLGARPRWLRKRALWLYAGCLLLLLAVPFVGDERNNARRWIETPVFDLQPSELAKLGLILALARVLHRNRLSSAQDWLAPAALALLPMGLVALQPDLGTALSIIPVTLGMLYLAGARGRVLSAAVLLVLLGGFAAWKLELGIRDYQAERVDTWVDSMEAQALIEGRRGPAFHAYHARVAIGNGGALGTGLGRGVANETGILPERESDSIFAVIAEEGGLVGAGALLSLYALLVVLLMLRAGNLRDRFARLVVGGVALYFAAHLFIHAGVNLGLLPMTGIPLPLFSTGGSSMLATFTALGLALGLAANVEPALDQDAYRAY